ncbi:MAG: aryl-sulfate sulfotransferase [Ruoffia tabacinasalis]|uniref:aryl-sulfate sulfotransferase n=1 Tax=unclassified Ruoffia TaxID=2862149 RepID=UPI00388BB81D
MRLKTLYNDSLPRMLILFTFFIFVMTPATIFAENNDDTENIDIRLYQDSTTTVYDFVLPDSEFIARNFNHTDPEIQTQYDAAVQKLKSMHNFSFEDPLFILNPYGTVTNGLYINFNHHNDDATVNYTITTEGHKNDHIFQRSLKNASEDSDLFESQIIGLVPGVDNHIELELVDNSNEVIDTLSFNIQMPKTSSFYPSYLSTQDGDSTRQLSDGLFYLVGTSQFNGFTYFFDNEGVLRAEIDTNSYRFDNLLFHEDYIIMANTSTQLIVMNSLGQITQYYDMPGYNMHHDFIIGQEDEVLILASLNDRKSIRREDIILSLDLNSGQIKELLDLKDVFGDYMQVTTPSYNQDGDATDLDWIHINSIEKVDEDAVLLSSRETSTIIKVSNLYDEPKVDYLIGPEPVWMGTDYSNLLLTQKGTFPLHGGQHSLNLSRTSIQSDGEYYVTFFNNNYWRYLTRPDYMGHIEEHNSRNFEPNPDDLSYMYKYLIDESEGTFELIQSFPVPYSSIVSNVDPLPNGNYAINSGKANVFSEYDSKGNLIRSYHYVSGNFAYRAFKDNFTDFWFQ